MTDAQDHPALQRLHRLERTWSEPSTSGGSAGTPDLGEPTWGEVPVVDIDPTPAAPSRPPGPRPVARPKQPKPERPRMGYQPALDGVRAISVIAVILYHAGFEWMHGGFFGVEVFFVVSGFLITSLLIEERDRNHFIALKQFWIRRFRRLLPALVAVLVAVGVWAVFWGTTEQHSQLRHDYPWGIFYLANWGQILSQTPYFSPSPTMFRHLWSLAVEEQWYAIWPLVFVSITRKRGDDRRRGMGIAAVAIGVMAFTALAASADFPTLASNPSFHVNFLYLSTITRSSGLLLGAALAFLWRPWKITGRPQTGAGTVLDWTAAVASVVLVASFFIGHVVDDATYLWLLPLVSIASAVLVAVAVHPWASGVRVILSWRPLVEIGKRSYGLYLWSWPVMRVCEAFDGSWSKFGIAIAITVPLNEACYRFLEGPIRGGAISRWWQARQGVGWRGVIAIASVAIVWMVGSMTYFYGKADPFYDAAVDSGEDLLFDPNAVGGTDSTVPTGSTTPTSDPGTSVSVAPESTSSTSSTTPTPTTQPTLPRRMVIVGDSTAHALYVNLPAGLENTFTIGDGGISGCSVYTAGTAVSSIDYKRSFSGCDDWVSQWVADAQSVNAEVALVVLGAWDVFDVKFGDTVIPFTDAQVDTRFLNGLQEGIDALSALGTKVALLEVPCMRPQDVKGQGTPPLPERGDDARVAHVNELLRQAAANNPGKVTFITGAQEYCTDPTIASSLAYRWDGVHSYKPGAKLTIETIAAQLLSIPYP